MKEELYHKYHMRMTGTLGGQLDKMRFSDSKILLDKSSPIEYDPSQLLWLPSQLMTQETPHDSQIRFGIGQTRIRLIFL